MHPLDESPCFEITVRVTSMDLARAVASLLVRSDLYDRVDGLCIAAGGDGGLVGESPFEPARGPGPRSTGGWSGASRRLGT
ncbi:MAG: hypothetical protein ACYS26_05160 [Planctomycetota bacterium]|jgi:hypothetical protein